MFRLMTLHFFVARLAASLPFQYFAQSQTWGARINASTSRGAPLAAPTQQSLPPLASAVSLTLRYATRIILTSFSGVMSTSSLVILSASCLKCSARQHGQDFYQTTADLDTIPSQ